MIQNETHHFIKAWTNTVPNSKLLFTNSILLFIKMVNPDFGIFKYQDDEYKITILYLLKEMSSDIKEKILNIVEINLEEEMNQLDYEDYNVSQNFIDGFYDSDWYQSD